MEKVEMPTKRTPIRHAHRPPFVVTDEMLELYAEHRALKCTCEPEPESMLYYDVPDECSGCRRGAELNHQLLRMMQLPCYETYAVTPVSGEGFLRREEEARRLVLEEALAGGRGKTPA
jgi:hypothetical protein